MNVSEHAFLPQKQVATLATVECVWRLRMVEEKGVLNVSFCGRTKGLDVLRKMSGGSTGCIDITE